MTLKGYVLLVARLNKEALLNAGKFPGGKSAGGIYTPFGDLGLPLILGAGLLLVIMMKKKK